MPAKTITIEDIVRDLKGQVSLSPRDISNYRNIVSAEYVLKNEEYMLILKQKQLVWLEIRKECKSDAQAERKWGTTELGQREIELKYRLKSLEKLNSSLRQMLDISQGEAKNIF